MMDKTSKKTSLQWDLEDNNIWEQQANHSIHLCLPYINIWIFIGQKYSADINGIFFWWAILPKWYPQRLVLSPYYVDALCNTNNDQGASREEKKK